VQGPDTNDTMTGAGGNDTLNGGRGSDILFGMGGADTLIGGGGSTTAPDYMFGGTGNDTYYVNSGMTGPQDLVDEGEGNPALAGGAGDVDTIISQGALFWDFYSVGEILRIERAAGGQIVGGKNVLNKTITGGEGNDIILTYGHSSRVDGGAGTDAISFELFGLGESYDGANTLIMKPGNGMDYLYGFESGVDKIDLSAFGYGLSGAQWKSFLVDVENGDNDYCFLYLGAAGQYLVFVGTTSSQIQAGDFIG
jgi:Ca2+-binding RTX toxin-like protein